MLDFLGANCLQGYALGTRVRPTPANLAAPTPAEVDAMDAWDESDLVVRSLIGQRISENLAPYRAATAAITWTNLENIFGQPHFTLIYRDFEEVN